MIECAKKIDLGSNLLLGKSEIKSGGNEKSSNLSDAYEAFIAALYLDQGYEFTKNFHIVEGSPNGFFLIGNNSSE